MSQTLWGHSWSPSAEDDRIRIFDWNEARRASYADTFDDLIEETVMRIRERPYLGREGRITGTRERVFNDGKHLIVYRVDDQAKSVEIVNVVSTSQKFPI
jgi:plasmid stabilization system protein ParE